MENAQNTHPGRPQTSSPYDREMKVFYDYFKSSNMWRVRVLEQNYIYFWFWGSILFYILQDGSILFLMTADRMNNVNVLATSLLAALALFQLYVDSLLPMLNHCVSPILSLNLYEILYSTHSQRASFFGGTHFVSVRWLYMWLSILPIYRRAPAHIRFMLVLTQISHCSYRTENYIHH